MANKRKHVIFCSLQNSGLSAIHPIIHEILFRSGWMKLYDANQTTQFISDYSKNKLDVPTYHFTHDKVDAFESFLNRKNLAFVFLHRDPRDAAVSWAFFTKNQLGLFKNLTYDELLYSLATAAQPELLESASKWLNYKQCLVIRFEQMKSNPYITIQMILKHISYYDLPANNRLSDSNINEIIIRNSFENQTNRKRGESSKNYLNQNKQIGFMFRKGISGEWKERFNDKLFNDYHNLTKDFIYKLGYQIPENKPKNKNGEFIPNKITIFSPIICTASIGFLEILTNLRYHISYHLNNNNLEKLLNEKLKNINGIPVIKLQDSFCPFNADFINSIKFFNEEKITNLLIIDPREFIDLSKDSSNSIKNNLFNDESIYFDSDIDYFYVNTFLLLHLNQSNTPITLNKNNFSNDQINLILSMFLDHTDFMFDQKEYRALNNKINKILTKMNSIVYVKNNFNYSKFSEYALNFYGFKNDKNFKRLNFKQNYTKFFKLKFSNDLNTFISELIKKYSNNRIDIDLFISILHESKLNKEDFRIALDLGRSIIYASSISEEKSNYFKQNIMNTILNIHCHFFDEKSNFLSFYHIIISKNLWLFKRIPLSCILKLTFKQNIIKTIGYKVILKKFFNKYILKKFNSTKLN